MQHGGSEELTLRNLAERGLHLLGAFGDAVTSVKSFIVLLVLVVSLLQRSLSLPDWLFAALLAAFLIILAAGVTSYTVQSLRKLRLKRKWQALGWAHYRQVLADAMIRSVAKDGQPRFDFLTFVNGGFEPLLRGGFLDHLQYSREHKPGVDVVIFDIEYLEDLRIGIQFPDQRGVVYNLVPIERFLVHNRYGRRVLELPPVFRSALWKDGYVSAIPLRWGVNGVAIRYDSQRLRSLKEGTGIRPGSDDAFDLAKLLADDKCREYILDPKHKTKVIALDWYLPTMFLLAWYFFGRGCHELDSGRFGRVLRALELLSPLLHADTPFIADPLKLARRIQNASDETLIVLGGGNWLNLTYEPPPDSLRTLPLKDRGFVTWCECLGFLAPDGHVPDNSWAKDATKLTYWLWRNLDRVRATAAFHAFDGRSQPRRRILYEPDAYSPTDDERRILEALSADVPQWDAPRTQLRRLPPRAELSGPYVSREQWQTAWRRWKDSADQWSHP